MPQVEIFHPAIPKYDVRSGFILRDVPGQANCYMAKEDELVPPKNAVSIVEDDESLRLALVGLIRSLGHEARGFASAEEYLSVQDGRCACVITDLHLPGITGIEMMLRLRDMGYSVPVIVITARAEAAIKEQAYASGALCVLKKPFDTGALVDCLERALAA